MVPQTTLIGRDQLVGSIVEHLASNRLVTLTGVGGVGKTHLATEVAGRVAGTFPDGVWIVAMGTVGDPAVVPDAVATTLGIAPQGETPMIERVSGTIAGRRLLLVLDNCEHVLGAAVELAEALLAGSGELRILTTSRASLRVADEREVPVPPLELDGGSSSPAVTLFVERARGVRPNFALDDHPATAAAVIEICRVLDGLPLGIELAAARMAGMGVVDVRDRLDDRFNLLEGDPMAPTRHRSLADLVGWSYELLDPTEREVLQRAAVFSGGFGLASYTGVFDVADDVSVLRALDRLVRASLVVADHAAGRVRYRLLETIRQFGIDALAGASSLETSRDRHAGYYAEEVAAQWEHWNGPGWRPAVDWVTAELANLRSAFRWSADRDIEVAADIAAHTALIGTTANLFEPISWAESILEPASAADIARLPRLYAAAGFACFVGRPATAVEHADRAMELEVRPDYDPWEPGLSAFIGALANVYDGNLGRYVDLASVAAAVPNSARAFALPALVDGLQASGRVDEAFALLDDSVTAAREVGNPFCLAYALWIAGMTLSSTDPARAMSTWDEGLDIMTEHGVDFFEGFLARDAARQHTTDGDLDVALALFESAIDAFHQAGNVAQLVITVASVPVLLDRIGRPEAAATLHAAMTQHPAGVHHVPELADLGDRLASRLGRAIDEPATVGRAMNLDDAVRYAQTQVSAVRRERDRASSDGRPAGLTRRELEVLRLVADGLTTRGIAERLFISAKTADRHIQNIYTKIGTTSRAAATRWAVDHAVVTSAGVEEGPS